MTFTFPTSNLNIYLKWFLPNNPSSIISTLFSYWRHSVSIDHFEVSLRIYIRQMCLQDCRFSLLTNLTWMFQLRDLTRWCTSTECVIRSSYAWTAAKATRWEDLSGDIGNSNAWTRSLNSAVRCVRIGARTSGASTNTGRDITIMFIIIIILVISGLRDYFRSKITF